MDKVTIGLAGLLLVFAGEAYAQGVTSRVTGTVGAVGSIAGGVASPGASASQAGSLANPGTGPVSGSTIGGALPGALEFKAGDKMIQFRGAAGVGDDKGNFKAGLGIPF